MDESNLRLNLASSLRLNSWQFEGCGRAYSALGWIQHTGHKGATRWCFSGQTFAGLNTLVVRPSSPFLKARSLAKGWEVGLLLCLGVPPEPPQIAMDVGRQTRETVGSRAPELTNSGQTPTLRSRSRQKRGRAYFVGGAVGMPPVSTSAPHHNQISD